MFSDVSVSFNYDYDIVAVSNYIPYRSVDIMVVCLKTGGLDSVYGYFWVQGSVPRTKGRFRKFYGVSILDNF